MYQVTKSCCKKKNYRLVSAATFWNLQQPNLLQDRFDSLDVKRAGFTFQLVFQQCCQNEDVRFCRRFYRSLTISRARTITFKLNLRSAMNAMSSVKMSNKETSFIPLIGAKRQCQGLFNSRCNLTHLSPKIHIHKFSRIISVHFLTELVGKFDKRTKHFHFMIILFVIPITLPLYVDVIRRTFMLVTPEASRSLSWGFVSP